MKTEEINEGGVGGRTNKVVFGGGYVRRTKKKTKTNKGEEEGGNKYTKVIIFFSITVDMWSLWREEESERDEHKVLWVLSSKRRVEEWRSKRKR